MNKPVISVVAATYKRPALLRDLLESLEAQTLSWDQFEVLIVDDESGPETVAVLEEFAAKGSLNLRWETQKNAGPATARNRGVAMAAAPLIAFTDDDCVVCATWLEDYLSYMREHPETAGVGGLLIRKHDNLVARWTDHAVQMGHFVKNGEALILITANACYRKEAFRTAGGFDTRIPWAGGEDPDLSRKVIENGGKLSVIEGALVRHTHRDTLGGVFNEGKLVGMSRALRMELGLYQDTLLPRTMAGMYYRHCKRALKSEAPAPEKGLYLILNAVKVAGFTLGALKMRFRKNRGAQGTELKQALGASNLKGSKHVK